MKGKSLTNGTFLNNDLNPNIATVHEGKSLSNVTFVTNMNNSFGKNFESIHE